jgi:DNA repair exonuclease SbcCD ATPase subunit
VDSILPWWGWALAGAGSVALLWLIVGLAVSGPARRVLTRRLDDTQRKVQHLETQRADREARVLSLEQRLSDSDRMRHEAERALAEREASLALLKAQLVELDRLRDEAQTQRERSERMERELSEAQLRAAEAVAARAELERAQSELRSQAEAGRAEAERLRPEAEQLRAGLAEARWELSLRAAQIRLAEGEREAAALSGLISREWRRRGADLPALSALNAELSELRDTLYQARRRLDELRRDPQHNEEQVGAAAAVEAQISARADELRELARQSGMLEGLAEPDPAELADANTTAGPLGGVLSYLRDTFGRLPAILTTPPTPALPPEDESAEPAQPPDQADEPTEPDRPAPP